MTKDNNSKKVTRELFVGAKDLIGELSARTDKLFSHVLPKKIGTKVKKTSKKEKKNLL
jgi:hypothetical protein